jgi:hypothetical protein
MIEFKGSHFERDVILWAVHWYVAYPISYRQLEEMMEEMGCSTSHHSVAGLSAVLPIRCTAKSAVFLATLSQR